jgi:hypothetical protein
MVAEHSALPTVPRLAAPGLDARQLHRGYCDCPRGHWYGPDYLLRALAREFRDGYAQWLAQQVEDAGVASPQAPWLNLLWFDPGLAATPPSSLPTLRHFEDMGIVSARSGWSGDESLVVFRDVSAQDMPIEGRRGEQNQSMFTIRLSKQAAVWRNVVALSWARLGQTPRTVQASTRGDFWRFSAAGRAVTLDWTTLPQQ